MPQILIRSPTSHGLRNKDRARPIRNPLYSCSIDFCGTAALGCGILLHVYRRNLPHIQKSDAPHFVTFRTRNDFVLPPKARDLVFQHCLQENDWHVCMHGFVVMPTHVHLVFTPLRDDLGESYTLAEIMNGIKGSSAHSINKLLKRKGSLWQDESMDRFLRTDEEFDSKMLYLMINPVRARLVKNPLDYPWLWRRVTQPGAAVPQRHRYSPEEEITPSETDDPLSTPMISRGRLGRKKKAE